MSPPPSNQQVQTPLLDSANTALVTSAPRRRSRRLIVALVLLVCFGLLITVIANRVALSDWWRLRDYQPPASIVRLADQDTMTDYTRHLFYLNKPQVVSTVAGFRKACPENKDTIVLGCYHPLEQGIFIYNVPDPKLAGVQQVTAAHEVLHAIYGRLSSKERAHVDSLLEDYYHHGLQDAQVKAEIALYQRTEPHAVVDEMHSTFGTEIANLPKPLNTYYQRLFKNRAVIVAYEQQYESEFVNRQNTIAADDRQLTAMKQQIDTQKASLDSALNQIKAEQGRLNGLLASGQTTTYNATIPAYNAQVDSYNRGVVGLHADIDNYNQLVATRNQVAGQLTTLDSAIDTRLTPQAPR